LAPTRRINWACATCTATCFSGAMTCLIRSARPGWAGAAAGAAAATSAGRGTATGTRRRTGTSTWASVLPEFPSGRQ
jgi:hypothetical protein